MNKFFSIKNLKFSRKYYFASKSFYDILDVDKKASFEEIRISFLNLAKKYHPDITKDNGEKFKEISKAYEILKDENKRYIYDTSTPDTQFNEKNQNYKYYQQSYYDNNRNYNRKMEKNENQTTNNIFGIFLILIVLYGLFKPNFKSSQSSIKNENKILNFPVQDDPAYVQEKRRKNMMKEMEEKQFRIIVDDISTVIPKKKK